MAKIKFSFSGTGVDVYHDGAMKSEYFYLLPDIPETTPVGKQPYGYFLNSSERNVSKIAVNYTQDIDFSVQPVDGVVTNSIGGGNYSIYKREYQEFQKNQMVAGQYVPVCSTYVGPWEPVALRSDQPFIRDFNISSGRSYQYILYPIGGQVKELEANADETGHGAPIKTYWDEWSLAELIPVDTPVDAPIIRKAYKVDLDNIWLFKYSLQTGEQAQNFQKQDIQTLGQYNRFGYGQQNFISGSVNCLLGSEIIPLSKVGYIERRRQSIYEPLTTNEKVAMLRQWRKIAFSPNPKLLKDIKGQIWIVQITSNSNSPQNFYKNQPDTISFSWKEIDSTDKVTIIGAGYELPKTGDCDSVWTPSDEYPEDLRCKN